MLNPFSNNFAKPQNYGNNVQPNSGFSPFTSNQTQPKQFFNSNTNTSIPTSNQFNNNNDLVKREGTFPVNKHTDYPAFYEESHQNNKTVMVKNRLQTVMAMETYKDYSVEELRMIDIKLKRTGKNYSTAQIDNQLLKSTNTVIVI